MRKGSAIVESFGADDVNLYTHRLTLRLVETRARGLKAVMVAADERRMGPICCRMFIPASSSKFSYPTAQVTLSRSQPMRRRTTSRSSASGGDTREECGQRQRQTLCRGAPRAMSSKICSHRKPLPLRLLWAP